jgi:hypothetical protein
MWIVMALQGCDDTKTPCELADKVKDPELIVGLGEDRFEGPIHDGDLVEPAWGSQGGRHLWLAVKTSGLAPGVHHGLFRPDEDVPRFHAELVGVDDGIRYLRQSWEFFAMDGEPELATLALGEFFVSGLPVEALEQPLNLSVTGTDVCGHEVQGDVDLGIIGMDGYGSY